jgi:hypothetical protein
MIPVLSMYSVHPKNSGVLGENKSGDGVLGQGKTGVHGLSSSPTDSGVFGENTSGADSVKPGGDGVFGFASTGVHARTSIEANDRNLDRALAMAIDHSTKPRLRSIPWR